MFGARNSFGSRPAPERSSPAPEGGHLPPAPSEGGGERRSGGSVRLSVHSVKNNGGKGNKRFTYLQLYYLQFTILAGFKRRDAEEKCGNVKM
jgi:hypothetical protein